MAAELKQTGRSQDTRIDVMHDHEADYWAEWNIPSPLRKAVQGAAPVVEDVRERLNT